MLSEGASNTDRKAQTGYATLHKFGRQTLILLICLNGTCWKCQIQELNDLTGGNPVNIHQGLNLPHLRMAHLSGTKAEIYFTTIYNNLHDLSFNESRTETVLLRMTEPDLWSSNEKLTSLIPTVSSCVSCRQRFLTNYRGDYLPEQRAQVAPDPNAGLVPLHLLR